MNLVLFGNAKFASLAWHAMTNDSPYTVVGFTVNRAFNNRSELHGLPVIDFETVEAHFDPASCAILVSVGWHDSNRLREQLCAQAKTKGFKLASYVASRSFVSPDIEIGENCMIFDGAIVQPFARLGAGAILRSGCHVSHHVDIGDFSFIAAHAVVGGGTRLSKGCFIGLNATVLDNITLAEHTIVGAGAIVHRDTNSGETYLPAPGLHQPGR